MASGKGGGGEGSWAEPSRKVPGLELGLHGGAGEGSSCGGQCGVEDEEVSVGSSCGGQCGVEDEEIAAVRSNVTSEETSKKELQISRFREEIEGETDPAEKLRKCERLDVCLRDLAVTKETSAPPEGQNWTTRENRQREVISNKDNDSVVNIVSQDSAGTIMAAPSREPAAGGAVVTEGLTAPSVAIKPNVRKELNVNGCAEEQTEPEEETNGAACANPESEGLTVSTSDASNIQWTSPVIPAPETETIVNRPIPDSTDPRDNMEVREQMTSNPVARGDADSGDNMEVREHMTSNPVAQGNADSGDKMEVRKQMTSNPVAQDEADSGDKMEVREQMTSNPVAQGNADSGDNMEVREQMASNPVAQGGADSGDKMEVGEQSHPAQEQPGTSNSTERPLRLFSNVTRSTNPTPLKKNSVRIKYTGPEEGAPTRQFIVRDLLTNFMKIDPCAIFALIHVPATRVYDISFKLPQGVDLFFEAYKSKRHDGIWRNLQVIQPYKPQTVMVTILFHSEMVELADLQHWLSRQCLVLSTPAKLYGEEGIWNGGYKVKVRLLQDQGVTRHLPHVFYLGSDKGMCYYHSQPRF